MNATDANPIDRRARGADPAPGERPDATADRKSTFGFTRKPATLVARMHPDPPSGSHRPATALGHGDVPVAREPSPGEGHGTAGARVFAEDATKGSAAPRRRAGLDAMSERASRSGRSKDLLAGGVDPRPRDADDSTVIAQAARGDRTGTVRCASRRPQLGAPWPPPRTVPVVEADPGADVVAPTDTFQEAYIERGVILPIVDGHRAGDTPSRAETTVFEVGEIVWSRLEEVEPSIAPVRNRATRCCLRTCGIAPIEPFPSCLRATEGSVPPIDRRTMRRVGATIADVPE